MRRSRDKLSRRLERLPLGERAKEVERLARKALEGAGVRLKWVKATPKRIGRPKQSG
jgi:hypothetical protein